MIHHLRGLCDVYIISLCWTDSCHVFIVFVFVFIVFVLATQNLKWKKVSFINNESSLDLLKSKFIVGRWAVWVGGEQNRDAPKLGAGVGPCADTQRSCSKFCPSSLFATLPLSIWTHPLLLRSWHRYCDHPPLPPKTWSDVPRRLHLEMGIGKSWQLVSTRESHICCCLGNATWPHKTTLGHTRPH